MRARWFEFVFVVGVLGVMSWGVARLLWFWFAQ